MKASPTYHSLGQHTEALQIDFDPTVITFPEVVDLFWKSHNPIGRVRSSQYKSAIWFSDDQQLQTIEASVERLVKKLERDLSTEILPLQAFYNAEDYHQKYCLQRHPNLMDQFNRFYPRFTDFVDSTAAARLNGFAGGHGKPALFEAEHRDYGIDVDAMEKALRR